MENGNNFGLIWNGKLYWKIYDGIHLQWNWVAKPVICFTMKIDFVCVCARVSHKLVEMKYYESKYE